MFNHPSTKTVWRVVRRVTNNGIRWEAGDVTIHKMGYKHETMETEVTSTPSSNPGYKRENVFLGLERMMTEEDARGAVRAGGVPR
jgi:hypothetical protein